MIHMRKFLAFVALATMVPAITARAGKYVTDSLSSKVLGAVVKYNVYLPDGFDKSDGLYPVVYLLHGLTDDYRAWRDKGRMDMVADELMRSGEARKMVIVMPNAGGPDTKNTWNGYFNMPGWNYEDFFFTEFMPAVEKKYRCISDKGHRAVMGLSMGGGGSTVYCQKHPECFSSCYAMSAWLDNDASKIDSDKDENYRLYCVCKAVHDNAAPEFVLNADEKTREELRTVKWFFDCGDDDFLLDVNVKMHQAMRDSGIKDELRIRNGVHNWEYWHLALRMALPFASRNFDN